VQGDEQCVYDSGLYSMLSCKEAMEQVAEDGGVRIYVEPCVIGRFVARVMKTFFHLKRNVRGQKERGTVVPPSLQPPS
jgi:hypothetical protein